MVIKLIIYLALFLSGISISLNIFIGINGFNLSDGLFLLLYLYFLSNHSFIAFNVFFFNRFKIIYLLGLFLIISLFLGYFFGTFLFSFELKSLFFILRLGYYFFILMPLIAFLKKEKKTPIIEIMVWGLVFSLLFNWFTANISSFFSLPGQNSLGYLLSIYLMVIYHEIKNSIFKTILIISCLISIFFTLSKSAIILEVFFIFFVLFNNFKQFFTFKKVLISFLSLIILINVFKNDIILVWDFLDSVLNTEISASEGSESNDQRVKLVLNGLYIGYIYPFGVGSGHYKDAVEVTNSVFPVLWIQPDPHNAFAHIAYSGGIIALVLYFLFLLFGFLKIEKNVNVYILFLFFLFNGLFHGETLTQNFFYIFFSFYLSKPLINKVENFTYN